MSFCYGATSVLRPEIFKYGAFVNPTEKSRPGFCKAYVPKSAIDMQWVDVVFNDGTHSRSLMPALR